MRRTFFCIQAKLGVDGNQEGIPNSMLEAMASGSAGFRHEPRRNSRSDRERRQRCSGSGVRSRSALTCLLDAAQDRHLLARLARAGAQAVAEKFDQCTQVRRLEDLYLGLIERRG